MLLAAFASGCLMTGFEPLDDGPSAGMGPQAGDQGSGGMIHVATGGQGGAGQGGGGTGGTSGVGGARDAGAGSGGMSTWSGPDATVPMSDGGVVSPGCTGASDFDRCEDGLYCTVNDYCFAGVCIGGSSRSCGDDCNTGTCNESQRGCELTPRPNGTECGFLDAFECFDGTCRQSSHQCTSGGVCEPTCTGGDCEVDCPNTSSCRPTCQEGSACTVDCQGAAECQVKCEAAECTALCQGTGTCDVDCTGAAICEVICTDASGCEETDCLDESECTLRCDEPEGCGFRTCWADDEQQCADGTIVCGGAQCAG